MAGKTEKELGLEGKITAVEEGRKSFLETLDGWLGSIPAKFEEFDLSFILENQNQFASISWLTSFERDGTAPLAKLNEAWYRNQQGDIFDLGEVQMTQGSSLSSLMRERESETDPQQKRRLSLAKKLQEFQDETKMKFRPYRSDYRNSPSVLTSQFEGKKLQDGIRLAKEAGKLYFDLQLEFLHQDLSEEEGKRPKWKIGAVKLANNPRGVPLCDVCSTLLRQLPPVE
jgi:hypothetical protein